MALKYGGKIISDYSAMQGPAPDGFHVPSSAEWVALCGILTTTFSMAKNATTMGTYLKMPVAGRRAYNVADADNVGSYGYYWSSSPYTNDNSRGLFFSSSTIRASDSNIISTAAFIRCFKDSSVIPTSSWITLYGGSSVATGAGVFHNAADGLISISGDGQTWYTIQDKNLGATTVFNQGDTLTDANCGNVFQRGNNYAFPGTLSSDSITTSSTQVDASNYGPGNYYSSSTYITRLSSPHNWSSVQNDNLWGGVTGVQQNSSDIIERYYGGKLIDDYSAMRGPCPKGFHVPKNSERSAVVNAGVSLGARTTSGTTSVTNFRTYLKLPNIVYLFPGNGLPGTGWTPQHRYYWGCRQMGSDGSGRYCDALDVVEDYGGSIKVDNVSSNHGCPVRPFKDKPVIPDSTWTTLYSSDAFPGSRNIKHSQSLGLITISYDGTYITIADKNAGATSVYNFGDTITSANGGGLYQWGNNYPFSIDGATTTSSTRVDTTGYGPGNYYSGSTFITGGANDDWFSPRNRDLWGGITGIQQKPAKVTEVYYNTTKIRPLSGTASGSVDFRNVTKADLTSQGWLTSGEPWVALDSTNGLYCSATSNDKYAGLYMPMDFTNAKKATLTWEFRQDRRSWAWGPRFGITQTNNVDKNSFVAFVNFCDENSYQQQELSYINNSGSATHLANQQISLTGGNYTIKLEINFETGEVVKTVTGATPYTQTGTLTSELIDTIKQFGYIAQRVGWGMPTASYCYTMAYEIEY